jgi:hypothetical protein
MGNGKYTDDAYSFFSKQAKTKSADEIFKQNKEGVIAQLMDPKGILFRECRDNDDHPESLPIMIWLDVTGSMGQIAINIAKEKLGNLMATLIKHGVQDAAVFFGAIGDHLKPSGRADKYPLQVGQFESGTNELVKCLTSTFIEKGGGNNHIESYILAHLFGGRHTSIDSFEKRGKKGFLFTIGDEGNHKSISGESLKTILGYSDEAEEITDKEAYEMASRLYHIFHIHVNEAQHKDNKQIIDYWTDLLGERLIIMEDHDMISEIIASTVAIMNGADLDTVTADFDANIAAGVKTALAKIDMSMTTLSKSTGIVAL